MSSQSECHMASTCARPARAPHARAITHLHSLGPVHSHSGREECPLGVCDVASPVCSHLGYREFKNTSLTQGFSTTYFNKVSKINSTEIEIGQNSRTCLTINMSRFEIDRVWPLVICVYTSLAKVKYIMITTCGNFP